jgi:hypothetical protein
LIGQTVAQSYCNGVGLIAGAQLVEHADLVALHGLERDSEASGDQLRRQALHHPVQYVFLPRCQGEVPAVLTAQLAPFGEDDRGRM